MAAVESDWHLSIDDMRAVCRFDGVIQGKKLASYLLAEGRFDGSSDAVPVQTTSVRGLQYVLRIDREGIFRWVDDEACLGDMDEIPGTSTENEQLFMDALEYVAYHKRITATLGLKT